jgi:hypothetical protein
VLLHQNRCEVLRTLTKYSTSTIIGVNANKMTRGDTAQPGTLQQTVTKVDEDSREGPAAATLENSLADPQNVSRRDTSCSAAPLAGPSPRERTCLRMPGTALLTTERANSNGPGWAMDNQKIFCPDSVTSFTGKKEPVLLCATTEGTPRTLRLVLEKGIGWERLPSVWVQPHKMLGTGKWLAGGAGVTHRKQASVSF